MRTGRSAFSCVAGLLLSASSGLAQSYAPPPTIPTSATVEVRLPADAELWFDGHPTAQQGDRRTFTAPGLRPGLTYTYDVLARWHEGGQDVVRRERLLLRAGQALTLQFVRPARQEIGLDHVSIQEIVPPSRSRKPSPAHRLPAHMSLVEFDITRP